MGLDMSSYSKIKEIDCVFDADGEPIDPATKDCINYDLRAYINSDFPGRAEGVIDKGVYIAEDSMSFRAGSYGFYSNWRNELARMAGYPGVSVDRYNTGSVQVRYEHGAWQADSGPFWELINFSDCEGVIGSRACSRIASDFAEWDDRAKIYQAVSLQENWFYIKYQEWRKAFEMGADSGAVEFR